MFTNEFSSIEIVLTRPISSQFSLYSYFIVQISEKKKNEDFPLVDFNRNLLYHDISLRKFKSDDHFFLFNV